MKVRLLWKLLGINILVLGFAMLMVWLAIDYLAADYFVTLMKQYNISPDSSHAMFVSAVHRYLIWATLAALGLTVLLGYLLMQRVLDPLIQMTKITHKIAAGDYAATVPANSRDEVGQLAAAFNRMAASLQKIEQLRKTMMIDVAHELRTPLTNIQGYLEALLDGVVAPTEETFELLQEETLRLAKLVEDILKLAKAEAARENLTKTEIRIDPIVQRILAGFQPQFDTKKIRVRTDFKPPSKTVCADSRRLAQVVGNLLQNALEHTPPGGEISIHTENEPGHVRVVFANSGREIAAGDLPYIFERFYRGEKSRSREHGGAGIGLAIVKELIEAHNGQVGAETSGAETRIWFSLPA